MGISAQLPLIGRRQAGGYRVESELSADNARPSDTPRGSRHTAHWATIGAVLWRMRNSVMQQVIGRQLNRGHQRRRSHRAIPALQLSAAISDKLARRSAGEAPLPMNSRQSDPCDGSTRDPVRYDLGLRRPVHAVRSSRRYHRVLSTRPVRPAVEVARVRARDAACRGRRTLAARSRQSAGHHCHRTSDGGRHPNCRTGGRRSASERRHRKVSRCWRSDRYGSFSGHRQHYRHRRTAAGCRLRTTARRQLDGLGRRPRTRTGGNLPGPLFDRAWPHRSRTANCAGSACRRSARHRRRTAAAATAPQRCDHPSDRRHPGRTHRRRRHRRLCNHLCGVLAVPVPQSGNRLPDHGGDRPCRAGAVSPARIWHRRARAGRQLCDAGPGRR